jgi:hypothetical protein
LIQKANRRRLRLFAVGCSRLRWRPLPDERSRGLLDLAERYADGSAEPSEAEAAKRYGYCEGLVWTIENDADVAAAKWANDSDFNPGERAARAGLIRDLLGNPFRPAALDPAWLVWNDGTVAKLAATIYDERRFADLPILADALEDAGCADAAILAHCRGGGEHVRGCWVVDLLTGRR